MPYIICTTVHLPGPAPAPQPWQFDLWSALIGAAVTLLLVGLAYRFRDALRLGWESALSPLVRLQHLLQSSAEDRYRELVTARAHSLTVPAHVAPLDALFVEPELLAPPPPQGISEAETLPASPQVLPLHRILGDHPLLVILGASGTGRTVSLAYLALMCARTTGDTGAAGEDKTTQGVNWERLPLYVSLPALDWDGTSKTDGQENGENEEKTERKNTRKKDCLKTLLGAAVAAVGGGSGLLKPLRQYLEAGQGLVLADGWDELSPQQRQQAMAWLSELTGTLPGNWWVVSTGMQGYAPLTDAGFVPLTLAPWDARRVETFARQWVEACTPADEKPPVALRELSAELRCAARVGAPPLELALRAFVYISDGDAPVKRAALFSRALDLLLWQEGEEAWSSAACRTALGQVALSLQQEGRTIARREEIEAAIEAALPPAEERPVRSAAHIFRTLTGERGLLRQVGSGRYAFVHPLWQAYLAARQLVAVDPGTLVERLDDPHWAGVLHFYAELGNIGPLVAAWMRNPDDMFRTRLCTLGYWVSVVPEGTAWRDGAMATLARSLLQPGQPASVRRALAQTLAATGVSGIVYFLKQALQHPDIQVRVTAVLGLTRLAGEADLPAFETALADEDLAVREAAVHGLASLGIDAATRRLEQMLLEGDDTLRPETARALANCGEDGVAFLHEAAESENTMVRRAAVFGLAQARARDLLEKMAREDEQWIVRSAATGAAEELEKQDKTFGIAPPPKIEQLPWLISWAAARREGVGMGEAARKMLWRALSEGDAPVRLAAAQVLAQVGRPDDVELLSTTLKDPNPAVATVAWEALAEISRRYELRME